MSPERLRLEVVQRQAQHAAGDVVQRLAVDLYGHVRDDPGLDERRDERHYLQREQPARQQVQLGVVLLDHDRSDDLAGDDGNEHLQRRGDQCEHDHHREHAAVRAHERAEPAQVGPVGRSLRERGRGCGLEREPVPVAHQLLARDPAGAVGRVGDVDPLAADLIEHRPVLTGPVDDRGQRQLARDRPCRALSGCSSSPSAPPARSIPCGLAPSKECPRRSLTCGASHLGPGARHTIARHAAPPSFSSSCGMNGTWRARPRRPTAMPPGPAPELPPAPARPALPVPESGRRRSPAARGVRARARRTRSARRRAPASGGSAPGPR